MCTVRYVGRFLVDDPLDVPWSVVEHLAAQLRVEDPSVVKRYTERAKTAYEHAWEIRDAYGYHPFEDPEWGRKFRAFLHGRAWTGASMAKALERVDEISAFRLGRVNLDKVPPNRLATMARVGLGSKAPILERTPEPKRTALLTSVVRHLEASAIDDALDLFSVLILLGTAFAEYGRIAKTLHLLRVVDPVDDTYRRQMNRQLTVQEFRHKLARDICHGKRGQIMQAYRTGQEDQLGALGLVLSAAVLWTTRYLDTAVEQLRALPAEAREPQRAGPLQLPRLHPGWRRPAAPARPGHRRHEDEEE